MIDKDLNTIYDCLLNKTYENRVWNDIIQCRR
jgi:hypothetical protein